MMISQDFLREFAARSYFGGKISYDFYRTFNRMCNSITHELFMGMEEFRSLPIGDRRQLMEVNGALLQQFKTAVTIDDSTCMIQGVDAAAKYESPTNFFGHYSNTCPGVPTLCVASDILVM